jgi:acyl-[acyl-carrier-protein]-phospholipid O-acyltransferase / long-chain-fatty-acid--[acyl-carrier-protein] ligase
MTNTQHENLILPRQFLRMCRRRMRAPKVADSTGTELTGAGLLTRALLLRNMLRRHVIGPSNSQRVGVLLPPTVAGVVVNAALGIDCRVAVNLNYTASSEIINDCIQQCGICHVITSHRVMARFNLTLNAELVYLEDFASKITLTDKLLAAATAWLAPIGWLERRLGLTKIGPDDLLTVIFTSGSTGRPKGVMLTHQNVGSNVGAVDEIIRLADDDVLLGILPLFHSFGYTTTLWTVLTLPPKGIYHFSPLEAREVGKLCREHGATIMITTPTFVRSYLRRCEPEDFAKLDVVFTGAERLTEELADAFEKRFGVRPVEGYGATELSPVVSANIPPSRASAEKHSGIKAGSVGRTLPGISAKVVDLDTGEDLGPNKSGMLLVAGPNVMKGYYGRPDLTAEVIREESGKGDCPPRCAAPEGPLRHRGTVPFSADAERGESAPVPFSATRWYITGDVATIDDAGFITITGRINRFSKLAGEMVPHIRIEEAIGQALNLDEDDLKVVVTSVPDAKKGERIVVLYSELTQTPEQICRALAAKGLPPLWIPSPENFRRIEAIPVLGTGKLDLKRMKDIALAEFRP